MVRATRSSTNPLRIYGPSAAKGKHYVRTSSSYCTIKHLQVLMIFQALPLCDYVACVIKPNSNSLLLLPVQINARQTRSAPTASRPVRNAPWVWFPGVEQRFALTQVRFGSTLQQGSGDRCNNRSKPCISGAMLTSYKHTDMMLFLSTKTPQIELQPCWHK